MLAAVAVVVVPATPAGAVTCTKSWNIAGSGTWSTPGNWSPSGVPGSTDVVCLQGSTTYTVTIDNAFSAKAITIGGTAGNQTLLIAGSCSFNGSLTLTNNSTITGKGRLTLDSTGCNTTASLIGATATPVLSNAGIITSTNTSGGQRNLEMSTTNNGTINDNLSINAVGTFTFVNNKTLNIATGQTFNWQNGDFTNATGGTIAATGSGDLVMSGGTFHQGGGTTTGTPPALLQTNINYTGTGASTLIARGDNPGVTLTGNIASGQTLELVGNCSVNSARLVNSGFTNAGTIVLDSDGCNTNASLVGASATPVLTNTGTILSTNTSGGQRNLEISTTNNGTINDNLSINAVGTYTFVNGGALNIATGQTFNWQGGDFSNATGGTIAATGTGDLIMSGGTFHQGGGTTTGTPPALLNTNINYNGTGASTLTARGDTGTVTLTGNLAAGQTLKLVGDCSFNAKRQVNASFTNGGTIVFDSSGCNTNASLVATTAGPVLTNTGTILSTNTSGGQRNLEVSVTNNGTINVNLSLDSLGNRTFVNNGTINIANAMKYNTRGSAFTLAGGSINGTGSGKVSGAGLFTQGNGTTTGTSPVLRSGSIAYTGTGASLIKATGVTGTLSGTLVAGQKLVLQGSCSQNAARQIASNVTNGGTILLKSAGCNTNASLTSPNNVPVLTNNGVITGDATDGGQRNLDVTTVNNGTINANQSMDAVDARTFTNNGTIKIGAGKTFNWENGDFTDATGGTINAGTGSLTMNGGTYHQGNGGTIGALPVVIDNGNINFNGSGPAAASVVFAHNTGGTLTGLMRANQALVIAGTCSTNASRATTAASFTNNGTITLQSNGCNTNATLDATGHTLVNGGTIVVSDSEGGLRAINGNVTNKGTVTVGLDPLTHTGAAFTSNTATSKIQVRVAGSGSFGKINSSGAFTLGGNLTISTDVGFWPGAGLDFGILNGGSARTGTFATTTGTTRVGEVVTYTVQYPANGVNLHTS